LGLVIIGGIKRIAKVTEKLVPIMAVIYILGAFTVLAYNYTNIIPAFISIFSHVFTGSAATGGFLGASIIYAFNRGVNRGLFSNEAGQGSAPIAHASARTKEPVSEGIVAILEPFIDTIIICTITGLVLLSSGVWNEKITNDFQYSDVDIVQGVYSEDNINDAQQLYNHVNTIEYLPLYEGELIVENGIITNDDITILSANSIAEDVRVRLEDALFSGSVPIERGKVTDSDVSMSGKSLMHSAPLTSEAFKRSALGDWGKYIVTLGLLLFAFSTAISWSYYGDRAMSYLFNGSKVGILIYRICYVIAFFVAAFTDTSIVWIISGITIALMTLPNLIGILLLHKEVKSTVTDYWERFKDK
jgi:AGCS family alanine or glycine:cation symporter